MSELFETNPIDVVLNDITPSSVCKVKGGDKGTNRPALRDGEACCVSCRDAIPDIRSILKSLPHGGVEKPDEALLD